jgi:predicted nucleic acid-binding protein
MGRQKKSNYPAPKGPAMDWKEAAVADTLSFAVMRRLRLTRVLSFNDHFRQFGEFEVIPDKFS